jgi:hypothetical protein
MFNIIYPILTPMKVKLREFILYNNKKEQQWQKHLP